MCLFKININYIQVKNAICTVLLIGRVWRENRLKELLQRLWSKIPSSSLKKCFRKSWQKFLPILWKTLMVKCPGCRAKNSSPSAILNRFFGLECCHRFYPIFVANVKDQNQLFSCIKHPAYLYPTQIIWRQRRWLVTNIKSHYIKLMGSLENNYAFLAQII